MEAGSGRILAAEALGTAILIMGGPGSAILAGGEIGIFGVAVAFGLSLAAAAFLTCHVSGSHVNPAVTLAMWLTRKVSGTRAVVSVIGQLVGGFAGAAIIYGIASGRDNYARGSFAANGWAQLSPHGFELGSVIVCEIVFTAVLVVVALTTTRPGFNAAFAPAALGVTLMLIHLITIPVDNTSVNPVRSLVTAAFAESRTDALQQVWVFLIFPLVGALFGVVAWLIVDEARLESTLLDTVQTRYLRDELEKVEDEVMDKIEDATD